MNDRDWAKFFDLVDRITELPLPLDQKIELVATKAKEQSGTVQMSFEEFMSWNMDPYFE